MEAISLLLNRTSQPRLIAPAPSGDALNRILQAGLRAPDHGALTPWKFIVCEGEGLTKLGKIFQEAAKTSAMNEADVARAPKLPLRAPMVIVAIADYKPHPKVPRVEQICSSACAVYAMQLAAVAQSFQGFWRTGSYATNDAVKASLNLKEEDEITGFLYLGTPANIPVEKASVEVDKFVEYWT